MPGLGPAQAWRALLYRAARPSLRPVPKPVVLGGVGMKSQLIGIAVVLAVLASPTWAMAGHGLDLDHDVPFTEVAPPPKEALSGGEGATWEFLATFTTGNPHTDLDFFTQKGNTFASVGTLAIGPNAGGQTIV